MITPECIISFPAIWEPKENPSGALKYGCSILIDKADVKGVAEFQKEIDKAVAKGKSTITAWKGKVPNFKYKPLRDGDEELANGDKTDACYKGRYFINCSSNTAPGVVGPNAKPLMDQEALYAGAVVRLDLNAFPYANSGNNGIGWGLNNVMLVRDGDRLDGKQRAVDAFAGFVSGATEEAAGDSDLM